MTDDDLEEAEANVRILIHEEMDVQHRLGEHPAPAQECPMCLATRRLRDRPLAARSRRSAEVATVHDP